MHGTETEPFNIMNVGVLAMFGLELHGWSWLVAFIIGHPVGSGNRERNQIS